jgi:tetratricopeptide (TPR) repeat protein
VQEYFVLLGNIQRQRQRYLQAYSNFQRAITLPFEATSPILFNLFMTARDLKRDSEAVTWFNRVKSAGGVSLYQRIEYAKFLEDRSRFAEAAVAYEEAADAAPKTYQSICNAGKNYWSADQFDKSLAAHRECIARATGIEGSKDYIQLAHRLMAEVLKNRNVFDQAEIHARQAIQLEPEDAFAYLYLAASLEGQKRPSEAVVAARAAVRLSDGKYSSMHFALGSALFDLKQYAEAAQAYEKAAELSPNESGSTYNVALCYHNLKFYADAVRWYRETLRRNPNHPDKEEISRKIAVLSKM